MDDGQTCRERKDVATDHARAGRLDQAVDEFAEALQLWDASDGDALRSACLQNRGICCQKLERLDEAEKDFSEAAALQLDEPAPYVNRGGVLFTKGAYRRALADFQKYLELDPDNALQMEETVRQHIKLCSQAVATAPDDFTGSSDLSDTDDDDVGAGLLGGSAGGRGGTANPVTAQRPSAAALDWLDSRNVPIPGRTSSGGISPTIPGFSIETCEKMRDFPPIPRFSIEKPGIVWVQSGSGGSGRRSNSDLSGGLTRTTSASEELIRVSSEVAVLGHKQIVCTGVVAVVVLALLLAISIPGIFY